MSLALSGSEAEGAVVTVGMASPIEARCVRRALSNRHPREQSSCSLQSSAAPSMRRDLKYQTPGIQAVGTFSVEERIICDFERIFGYRTLGVSAKSGESFCSI